MTLTPVGFSSNTRKFDSNHAIRSVICRWKLGLKNLALAWFLLFCLLRVDFARFFLRLRFSLRLHSKKQRNSEFANHPQKAALKESLLDLSESTNSICELGRFLTPDWRLQILHARAVFIARPASYYILNQSFHNLSIIHYWEVMIMWANIVCGPSSIKNVIFISLKFIIRLFSIFHIYIPRVS